MMEVLSECVLFEDASDQRGVDKILEETASSVGTAKCGGFFNRGFHGGFPGSRCRLVCLFTGIWEGPRPAVCRFP